MTSWKTTLCGLLGGLCIGLAQISELGAATIKVLAVLGAFFPNLGLMFSRDNNVTSEQALGTKPGPSPIVKALLLFLIPASLFIGCRSLAPDGPYAGDKLAYEADTIIVTSYDTLHTFVKWEKENRVALDAYPEIKKSADAVRIGAQKWIATAIAAREAYTKSPTPETRDALTRAIAVLRTALAESVKYLNQHTP